MYKQSKSGIERLEIYDNSSDVSKHATCRIITLENCVKISPISSNLFIVITKNTQYEFGTLTEDSLSEWVSAIQSVAFKDDVSKITSIEEDNDLYCSSGEGVFQVTLWPSDASKRCGLEPNKYYTLILTSTAIQLRNTCDNKLLYTWPYCFIRRYGYRSGKFTFEAGRKCDSGEGVFHLEHSNQHEIFRSLSSKMKSMKKLLSGESTTSLLECDDQLHAALSMEARSRSPLPPSYESLNSPTTSSTRVHDFELNNSMNSIISFTDVLEKVLVDRKPLPKPKPQKPPRKNLPMTPKSPENIIKNDISDINKYDEVEVRQDAWKTQGLTEVRHTESIDDDLETYVSWEHKKIIADPPKNPFVKIKSNPVPIDESYDKLQFFGSTSKLNIPGKNKTIEHFSFLF